MKKKIVNWIRVQVKKSGAKGIVIGVSGGLDSAVAAALAKEAVGAKKLLALIMPCRSMPIDLKDAGIISKKLGIKTKTVDLSGIYNGLIRILPERGSLAAANLKPRLRMLVLYYFANKFNYLVCGTSNKSELMMGYFTKYGDGAADILPMGDLLKKEVRLLAEELGLPRQIIVKPPSAGLWAGQTDEGEMGITYAELDDILGRMEKKRRQVSAGKKVDKIKTRIEKTGHKRRVPAICYI